MSLSREDRIKNINEALRLMLQDLGDLPIIARFQADDPVFSGIHKTTWKYLLDNYFTTDQSSLSSVEYSFTGYGYRKALEVSGELDKPELKQKLGKLCAAFKSIVDGRAHAHDDFAYLQTFADQNQMDLNWIYNVIESDLIKHVLNRTGVTWESKPTTVRIPVDFGLPLL